MDRIVSAGQSYRSNAVRCAPFRIQGCADADMPRGIKWTDAEEAALRAGMRSFGNRPGHWSEIIEDPRWRKALEARTNVDLKDKWCVGARLLFVPS